MLLSLHPRLYLYLYLYMYKYLLSDDAHDDDHEAYRLHDDEDDDDAEIYFTGQCCETRWFASAFDIQASARRRRSFYTGDRVCLFTRCLLLR